MRNVSGRPPNVLWDALVFTGFPYCAHRGHAGSRWRLRRRSHARRQVLDRTRGLRRGVRSVAAARHNPVLLLTLGAFIVVSLVMAGGACGSSGTTTIGVRGANLARKHFMLQISRLGPAAARLPS
jgi:hypothetical protein